MKWIDGYYTIQRIKGPHPTSILHGDGKLIIYWDKPKKGKKSSENIENTSGLFLLYLWCKNDGMGITGRDLSVFQVYLC